MKLYYKQGACSLATRSLIHELNIPCEFEAVDLVTKKTQSGNDFTQINPKGSVPTLVLDDKTVLTENAAIQQYLSDTYKGDYLLPAVGNFKRYQVLEWLNFITTDLHSSSGAFFNPLLSSEVKETVFKPKLKNKLNFVSQKLGDKKHLLGEEISVADFYLFVVLSWLGYCNLQLSEWPNLSEYFNRLKQRTSIQRALKEERLA